MAKKYEYISVVNELLESEINNFQNILSNIKYVISNIADVEKKCKINEEKIKKQCNEYIGVDNKNILETDNLNNLNTDLIKNDNLYLDNLNETDDDEKNSDKSEDIEKNLCIKFFKIIALKCHPDKTNDLIKNKIFIYVNNFKKDLDCIKILYLISKTDIDNIELSDIEYKFIENKLLDIEFYKNKITKTIYYNWDEISDEDKMIYLNYIKNQYEKL